MEEPGEEVGILKLKLKNRLHDVTRVSLKSLEAAPLLVPDWLKVLTKFPDLINSQLTPTGYFFQYKNHHVIRNSLYTGKKNQDRLP